MVKINKIGITLYYIVSMVLYIKNKFIVGFDFAYTFSYTSQFLFVNVLIESKLYTSS